MWFWIIVIAIVIGGIIGFLGSEDGHRGEDALGGAVAGGMGCGYLLFRLFLWGVGIIFFLWLFSKIF